MTLNINLITGDLKKKINAFSSVNEAHIPLKLHITGETI